MAGLGQSAEMEKHTWPSQYSKSIFKHVRFANMSGKSIKVCKKTASSIAYVTGKNMRTITRSGDAQEISDISAF